jgi:nitrogen-specific signal transduction histidine kinase
MITTRERPTKRKVSRARVRKARKPKRCGPLPPRVRRILERARLDLLSTQEELRAIRDEVQSRNEDLMAVNAGLTGTLDNVQAPLLLVTRDLRIRYTNAVARAALKLSSSDTGCLLRDTVLAGFANIVAHAIESRQELQREVKSPLGRWCSVLIRPHSNGATLIWSDIDQLHQARDGEREGREAAEHVSGTKDALIASLTTELQIPLDSIRGYAALIRSTRLNETDYRRVLDSMAGHAEAQRQRIEALLESSCRSDETEPA